MATAPNLVATYSIPFGAATTPRSVSITCAVGDVLTVEGSAETQLVWATPTSTPSLTWTLRQNVTPASTCDSIVWTTTVASGQDGTYNLTVSTTNPNAYHWGIIVKRWSGSAGIGNSAKTNVNPGAPSLAITCSANSAVSFISGDFLALSGTRTYRTVNSFTPTSGNGGEDLYLQDGGFYTVYSAHYPDVGSAGSKTVGLSAPTGQGYSICAVEILGSTSVNATLQATGPQATASLTADERDPATIAATGPIATGSLTASSLVAGTLAAVGPVASATLTAVSQDAGTLVAQGPTAGALITGTPRDPAALVAVGPVAAAALTGANGGLLQATGPTATASLTSASSVTGTLAAVGPVASATFTSVTKLSGTLDCAGPVALSQITGSVADSGVLAAVGPVATASFLAGQPGQGILVATGPQATASLTATETVPAALVAVGPVAAASLTAGSPVTGSLAASGPIALATFAGQSATAGALSATGPTATGSLVGLGALLGELAASGPVAMATLTGSALVPVAGVLVAVGPAASATMAGHIAGLAVQTPDARTMRILRESRQLDIPYEDRKNRIPRELRVIFAD